MARRDRGLKGYRALASIVAMFGLTASTLAFDTKWHADATRAAMEKNGFSADARLLCQFTNYLTDYFSADAAEEIFKHLPAAIPRGESTNRVQGVDIGDMARMHFDASTSEAQVERQWATLEANTTAALLKWAAEPSVKSWIPARGAHDHRGRKPSLGSGFLFAFKLAEANETGHRWCSHLVRGSRSGPGQTGHQDRLVSGWRQIRIAVSPRREQGLDRPDPQRGSVRRRHTRIGRLGARIMAATPTVPWGTLQAWTARRRI